MNISRSYTFVTEDGLFTPTRVPQGIMNAILLVDDDGLEKSSGACLFDFVVDVKVIG